MTVFVIGNCTVDLSFSIPRFPRPGETLLARERTVDLGGKGANQAVVASRFGVDTVLAAPVGSDAEGEWAIKRLAQEGLPQSTILRTDEATDQSILYVTPDGENCIVSSHKAAASTTPAWAEDVVGRARPGDILLMQGNLPLETTVAALAVGRRKALRTVVNPAPIQYEYNTIFALSDVAILNEVEAAELGRHADPIAAGRAIHEGGVPQVLVTLGEQGAVLIVAGDTIAVPAPRVSVVDTVGAGDTFCGAFVAAWVMDLGLKTATRIAVEAASLSVTRRGTQSSFPTRAEAAAIIDGYRPNPRQD